MATVAASPLASLVDPASVGSPALVAPTAVAPQKRCAQSSGGSRAAHEKVQRAPMNEQGGDNRLVYLGSGTGTQRFATASADAAATAEGAAETAVGAAVTAKSSRY